MIGMVINRALVEFESGYHHVKNVVGERLVNGVWRFVLSLAGMGALGAM